MKVLFISDFSLFQNSGGAQVSNDFIIKKGESLGYDITLHNFDSSTINLIYNYDLVISSNMEILNKDEQIFNYIINHNNHIRLEHDSCLYLSEKRRKDLFTSAKKSFFLSEFHLDFFKKSYGNYFTNTEIVYDYISLEHFDISNEEKEFDIVYCGFLHPLKGLNNLIDFALKNKDRKISVFGWGDTSKLKMAKNIEYLGEKNNLEISNIFKKSKFVFHSPIVNEPFCRMVGEALLCGCEIIGDTNKIGSYLEYQRVGLEKFKEKCSSAAEEFWQKAI